MLIPMTKGNGRDEALRNQRLDAALEQIARGDRQALAALYRETNPAVYGFAFSVVKNTHDAEDVLQDTYLRIYAAAPGYVSVGKPMAWILTICRNLCLQRLRERTRQAEIPQEDWERYLEGCPGVTTEDRMVIAECMNKLSDEERQIVVHPCGGRVQAPGDRRTAGAGGIHRAVQVPSGHQEAERRNGKGATSL
ncbi:RNA polymerase sigma factor [Evtepia sp.]|uniref:RNA polymerase sigma factor n=1 Tax=Evtepia sp. TaxID=2773933 RepID=UPI00387EDD3A